MSRKILVINAGSSSIKFKVYEWTTLSELASGLCERIFVDGIISVKTATGQKIEEKISMPTHDVAIEIAFNKLKELKVISSLTEVHAVGHRVITCGSEIINSIYISDDKIDQIEKYKKLAPLHMPPEITVIRSFRKLAPHAKNVGVFDTSFHNTMPQVNYDYCLDRALTKKYEIRRYGFHGTSYRYITLKMQEVLNKKEVNLIVCHIGNGASVCAIKNSKSFNTSMGLTPLEGLIMGTRCGDIDGSVANYLAAQGLSATEVDNEFNKKAGFKAFCGSNDVRDVTALARKGDKNAIIAREIQVKRICDYIVKYNNQLDNKVDAIVFTAGVGENDKTLLMEVADKMFCPDITIDSEKNLQSYPDYIDVTGKNSAIKVYKVHTNEELVIALDTKKLGA